MHTLNAIDPPPALARMAHEALRASILNGRLRPGVVYNETALAEELGISKTPVREALLELAAQGLVTVLPRRGVMVTRFTEADVEEVFEVRRAIELALVEKVAREVAALDLSPVDRALKKQDQAIGEHDKVAFLGADRDFHKAFGQLARNRRLAAILDNVRDLVHVMGMEALAREDRPKEVLEEHRKVVDAVEAGDPDLARRAMARHLELSKESVLTQYRLDGGATPPSSEARR